MFVTGPEVVKTVTNETVTAEALGGAAAHTRTSGVAHMSAQDDVHAMAQTRALVSYLPSSNTAPLPVALTEDSRERQDEVCPTRTPTPTLTLTPILTPTLTLTLTLTSQASR